MAMVFFPDTLTGDVIDRFNPAYDAARQDNNQRLQFFPQYIDFCESVHDVQNAVNWCREHAVPLRGRSGRHSYEDYSVLNGGVVIDVSRLNDVTLDQADLTARIGAGAQLGHVYDELWNQGMTTIPGGSCTGVGIAGLTLGGGFGLLTRLFGLTCDSLLELEMVDWRGRVLRANASENRDLFWASCGGGGGNFGVTTSFVFKARPIDRVTVFQITWNWSDIRAVIAAWQAWANPDTLDRRMVPILLLNAQSAGAVTVLGEFVGPLLECDQLIQPLLQAVRPIDLKIVNETYIEAVHRFVGESSTPADFRVDRAADPALDKFKNTSAFAFGPFPAQAVDTIVSFLEAAPSPNALVQLNLHGGAEADRTDDATAYPWRQGVWYSLQYQTYWSDPAQGPALIQWVEAFRRAMQRWTHGAYVNYIDRDIADWPTAFYDDNLARLLRVKREYDPFNLFDFPQGLGRVRLP